jgi:preprotein translocase subunit SecG
VIERNGDDVSEWGGVMKKLLASLTVVPVALALVVTVACSSSSSDAGGDAGSSGSSGFGSESGTSGSSGAMLLLTYRWVARDRSSPSKIARHWQYAGSP